VGQQSFIGAGQIKSTCERFGRCVQYTDISACEIWPQRCVFDVLKALESPSNYVLEPRYQNDTPFHRPCLSSRAFSFPIYMIQVMDSMVLLNLGEV